MLLRQLSLPNFDCSSYNLMLIIAAVTQTINQEEKTKCDKPIVESECFNAICQSANNNQDFRNTSPDLGWFFVKFLLNLLARSKRFVPEMS